ncbi:hypothetical protein D050_3569B, partial [Vibrio parahaemolyticus VPCR-2009]
HFHVIDLITSICSNWQLRFAQLDYFHFHIR